MTTLPVFHCTCGQLNHTTFLTVTARCTCGLLLWPQVNRPGGTA